MNIMLGDLTVEQMERRTGVESPAELKEYMTDRYQPAAANVQRGKWHCFDLPFMLVCGDIETAQAIYNQPQPLADQFKEPLQIGVQP